jgi:hypothetical protein
MRALAALGAVVVLLAGCSNDRPPSSVFDSAGYHVRGGAVYYLNAFPGAASRIDGADPASFHAFDQTYARDKTTVYYVGHPLAGADAPSFHPLNRPGFAADRGHVYRNDHILSDDPAHFTLLDSDLSKDSAAVYWSDGHVFSTDPTHFMIISSNDHYLFAKDARAVYVNGNAVPGADPATFRVLRGAYSRDDGRVFYFDAAIPTADAESFRPLDGPYAADARRVYWMGQPIDGADPATFRILNVDFECTADATRAYYRKAVVAGADPRSFPAGRAVTGCDETSVRFGQ